MAAHHLAERQEISMAELVRRGLEYMLKVMPEADVTKEWQLPAAHDLQANDPFSQEDWRAALHMRDVRAAEQQAPYGDAKP